MMKKLLLCLLSACAFVGATNLVAQDGSSYNDGCNSSYLGGLTVGADFLFWHASVSDLDYVVVFQGDPAGLGTVDGKYHYIEHGWDPGVRVYLDYGFCNSCYSLGASYTWFRTDNKAQIVRSGTEFIFPTLFNQSVYTVPPTTVPVPGSAPTAVQAKNKIEYQTFDLLMTYHHCCFGPCQILRFFGGIEGLKLEQETNLRVDTNFAVPYVLRWDSDFKALGLKIGSSYEWNLQCGLGIDAGVSFSVLAGENQVKNRQQVFVTPQTILERSYNECGCLCVPGGRLGIGISYDTCLCGWDIGGRIGYEFTSWWNVPVERRFMVTSILQQGYATSGAGGNLILHGLYAGAYVNF